MQLKVQDTNFFVFFAYMLAEYKECGTHCSMLLKLLQNVWNSQKNAAEFMVVMLFYGLFMLRFQKPANSIIRKTITYWKCNAHVPL